MSQSRDNIKAGLFIILGSILALVVVFTLADIEKLLEDYQQVNVVYKVSDGVKGLSEGADVTLGDQSIGTVVAIEDVADSAGRVNEIRVVMEIPRRYQLYTNAAVELVVPPLGSGTRLNIRSVGSETPYQPGTDLTGRMAGSALTRSLLNEAGIKDLQRQQIALTIQNISILSQALVGDDEGKDLRQTIANLRALTDQLADEDKHAAITEMLANLRDMSRAVVGDDKGGDIRASLANLSASLLWVKETLHGEEGAQVRAMVADLASTSENLRLTTEALKGEDGKQIREMMANLHDVTVALTGTDKARDIRVTLKNLADISQAVAGDNRAQELRQMMGKMRDAMLFVETQLPVIERAFANVLIMTGQLKLAAIEIRRSPWRLMYKPKDQELETENLYDAARSFALAAGTLDAATQTLKAASGNQNIDRERLDAMVKKLETVLGKVETAEGAFWQAMQDNRPSGAPAGQ